jgi:hypothetical protein
MTTSTTNPRFPLTPITHISAVPGRVGYLLVAVDIELCLRDDFDEVSRLACAAGAMVQLRGERLQEG